MRNGVKSLLHLEPENICSLASLRWMNFSFLIATGIAIFIIVEKLNPANVCIQYGFQCVEEAEVISVDVADHVYSHHPLPLFPLLY